MWIRYYGFLANRCRKAKLAQIRNALAHADQPTPSDETDGETLRAFVGYPCTKGSLQNIFILLNADPSRLSMLFVA